MGKLHICPHFRNIDEEYFLQVFTKASSIRGEDKELFYFTHYPIDLYDKEEEVEDITETHVLSEILKKRIGNFIVVIEGETGTGKSELCIYLGHELRNKGLKVLQIDKNSDLMSILADDLPNFYKKHTGKTIQGYENLKHLQNQLKKNIKLITLNIGTRAINNLTKMYPNLEVDPEDPKVKRFIKFLEVKLVQLISRNDDEFPSEIEFIKKEDLKSGERDFNFGIPGDNTQVSRILNENIWEAIKSEQKIPTIDKMIEEINMSLDGRWTIIFEDFSITSLDQKKLQNFMERDNINDKVNFIIAGLADKLRILHTPTAVDRLGERIRFFKTSKSGISNTLFLTEENCVDFIRPYLCYFKIKDGSLDYERNQRGKIVKTIHSGDATTCNSCNKCPKNFRDIFPFNEIFLKRIYNGLKIEEQKPRKYVEVVGSIFGEYINFKNIPVNSTALGHLANGLIVPQSIINLNNDNLVNLIRWYATEENDALKVPLPYADLLGIDYSQIDKTYIQDNSIVIPKTELEDAISTRSEVEVGGEEIIPEWKVELDKYSKYISNWRTNPYDNDWFEEIPI